MPQLQIPKKGLRKRRSTTVLREEDISRKKVAHEPEEKTIIDMRDLMSEIEAIVEAKRRIEKQARNEGMRVEKTIRMRPRPYRCACRKKAGVKHDGTCSCGHSRCP